MHYAKSIRPEKYFKKLQQMQTVYNDKIVIWGWTSYCIVIS